MVSFQVVDGPWQIDDAARDVIFLWNTGWDDWFKFATLHDLRYLDATGERHDLGNVKIGQFGLLPGEKGIQHPPGVRRPDLPSSFVTLDERFFSLGQDVDYYEKLVARGDTFRIAVLTALNDISYDRHLRATSANESVTTVSLMRSVSFRTLDEQFDRISKGGVPLTPYAFTFTKGDATFPFEVTPRSTPPTNIHVLIGRNGVGKSTFLRELGEVMVDKSRLEPPEPGPWDQLSNVVSVSFSAFDHFDPRPSSKANGKGLSYHYVGLRKYSARAKAWTTKDSIAINREMRDSVLSCLVDARRGRLHAALGLLENDPIFAEAGLADLLDFEFFEDSANLEGAAGPDEDERDAESELSDAMKSVLGQFGSKFRNLSSGHRIVLLTIGKLVETVEERSLVLLDEPEAHLHPPLLSAFVRAVSSLLTNRNGMAVVATHSPVVLQEVPSSCVSKLNRFGNDLRAERPRIETFGENVGILTNEVFGLEVTGTGFHKMLAEAATNHATYEEAVASFGRQLGSEARAILRSMMTSLGARGDVGS